MYNLQTNVAQIFDFASQTQVPVSSPRAIIREYLQSLAVSTLYSLPHSEKLVFVGGTSLRLLRNIDRFSEDLDFDNLGLSLSQIKQSVEAVVERMLCERIPVELYQAHHPTHQYFEFRFPHLLHDLKITTNDKEKLMIKFDTASTWKGHHPEIILFSRYGFIEHIVTNPLNHLLVQKLASYVQRKQTQPRDLYDIVWLYSQGARFDHTFARTNNLASILDQGIEKYAQEGLTATLKTRLRPFLFQEDSITKLSLIPDVFRALKEAP